MLLILVSSTTRKWRKVSSLALKFSGNTKSAFCFSGNLGYASSVSEMSPSLATEEMSTKVSKFQSLPLWGLIQVHSLQILPLHEGARRSYLGPWLPSPFLGLVIAVSFLNSSQQQHHFSHWLLPHVKDTWLSLLLVSSSFVLETLSSITDSEDIFLLYPFCATVAAEMYKQGLVVRPRCYTSHHCFCFHIYWTCTPWTLVPEHDYNISPGQLYRNSMHELLRQKQYKSRSEDHEESHFFLKLW